MEQYLSGIRGQEVLSEGMSGRACTKGKSVDEIKTDKSRNR